MIKFRIFTDGGSFKKSNGKFRGVSSYRFYKEYKLIVGEDEVLEDKTNNYSEIYSIAKALKRFLQYLEETKETDFQVELYSDSLLCINSLTKWIYNWIKTAKNGVFYNSNKEEVANQEIIKDAFKSMMKVKDKIKLYHINSHKPASQLPQLYKKFLSFNKCKITYEEFCFAYLKNKECDDAIKEVHEKYLAAKALKS